MAVLSPSRSARVIRLWAGMAPMRLSGGVGQAWSIRLGGGERSRALKVTGSANRSLAASTCAMAATAIGRATVPASGKARSVFQYQVAVVARFITPIANAPGRARSARAGNPASRRLVFIGPVFTGVLSLR